MIALILSLWTLPIRYPKGRFAWLLLKKPIMARGSSIKAPNQLYLHYRDYGIAGQPILTTGHYPWEGRLSEQTSKQQVHQAQDLKA